MVSRTHIDLHSLTMEELAGVLNLYPWYGAARKELCRRMIRTGGDAWGEDQYAEMALYIGDRGKIAGLLHAGKKEDCADKDVADILKSWIAPEEKPEEPAARPVRVVGGDYFSQAEYDHVRTEGDRVFSRFAAKAKKEPAKEDAGEDLSDRFCTESLAEIYAEQGYPEMARRIYSKLLLANPEKSAYFAALIEKLN